MKLFGLRSEFLGGGGELFGGGSILLGGLIELAHGPVDLGDATLCHSLFQNLIKNACEAAPRKSKVHVILKDENPLRILIQNKGVVPRDIRDVFFDKFVTQNKSSGSGLGTYSARLLAVAQHGSIDMACDDALNETTVTVWLPRCALQLADKPVADNSVPNP